ncbi:hypothetical protein [Palleronia sp.]|uniref:hypothetical protein n=1 Tax=Palleronia sp. TaxID=1940284 RepID=UPI0035C7FC9A
MKPPPALGIGNNGLTDVRDYCLPRGLGPFRIGPQSVHQRGELCAVTVSGGFIRQDRAMRSA